MTLDEYIDMNSDNISINELCEKFNLSVPTVYRHLRVKGIKIKRNDSRLEKINELRKEGKTYQEIGESFGLSRQRIEQLIHGHN